MGLSLAMDLSLRGALLGGARAQLPASLVFLANGQNAADQTTYTFTSQPLGAEAADRRIIVAFSTRGGANFPPSAVSIAGVAGTVLSAQPGDGAASQGIALYGALVPTGTSGDISVTWANPGSRCGMAMWALYNAASMTPTDVQRSTVQNASVSLNIPNNGCAIGYGLGASGGTQTWAASLTKLFDAVVETTLTHSGSQGQFTTGGATTLTDSYQTAAGVYSTLFASWDPK